MKVCPRCGDALEEGVRFCVACGAHLFDADAGLGEAALRAIGVVERRKWWERARYWPRRWAGVRR